MATSTVTGTPLKVGMPVEQVLGLMMEFAHGPIGINPMPGWGPWVASIALTTTLPYSLVTRTLVFFHAPSFFKSDSSISMIPQAVRYNGFSFPPSIATPCWMVRPEIRFKLIFFVMVILIKLQTDAKTTISGLRPDHLSPTGEADHIIRAGIDTHAAPRTEFRFHIKVYRLPVLDSVDLLFRHRVHRMQFECIDWTCDDAVATTGTSLHVYMY
eukprot:TRINITY_DN16671_c0_g1_i1.p1 TRINITY_DN16671_c0_g1~~TRINITY_DN16671_c0_g1_i1.p1  ORF type:complete len:213 (+),score=-20.70 TRINITY_DN16671_c0_g1_i1:345-983(+)